ncbi:MAG: DNA-binding protein [Betaproteobacteria bacterium]|nr:DNA-binding protein [Betaproteobacteria bacterium]
MPLVDTPTAAKMLGVSPEFLERDRWLASEDRPPRVPFVQVGERAVRYDLDQLHAYIKSRTVGTVEKVAA